MRRGFCAKAFCAALLLCIQSKTSFKLAAQIHFRTLLFCICAQDVCARRGKKSELIGVKTLLLSNVSALAGRCVYKFNEPKRNVPVGRRCCEVEKFIDIIISEQRMAALTRLRLTTSQVASMLGISVDSVHISRQRLRQRLQVGTVVNLDEVVANL